MITLELPVSNAINCGIMFTIVIGDTSQVFDTFIVKAGNTKGGSITAPLTSCLTGLELLV
jgi:hypothetical protein